MKVALGGQRVGSGNKMNIRLRNYERSTHNLSQSYKTSAGVGILYPCMCKPVMRGDKFDVEISAGVRTVPSKGAMFGTFKLQIDYYFCPVRLYTGILHNNPINLGLNMKSVYFPQFKAYHTSARGNNEVYTMPFSTSSLLHYLGLSGLGNGKGSGTNVRAFNAIPVLAYYDIFKNYYSNKQENKAYMISQQNSATSEVESIEADQDALTITQIDTFTQYATTTVTTEEEGEEPTQIDIRGYNLDPYDLTIEFFSNSSENVYTYRASQHNEFFTMDIYTKERILLAVNMANIRRIDANIDTLNITYKQKQSIDDQPVKLTAFDLSNIDEMRTELLSYHTLGAPYVINDYGKLPYSMVAEDYTSGTAKAYNEHPLNGLLIKTYQSDMFNNWLAAEYIDGVNGISQITKVSTSGGGFTIDALNFAEKMYDLLNRIVVSGNTYDDWQDVVYEQTPKKHLESPMYLGGVSQEIVFEEIVASAATEQAQLGTMGGRGVSRHRKGGHVRAKFDEAGFIIGIMSITPRIDYTQGNQFYFTDLLTMDDFHKPALDGIGFQDLIGERMAYFDTIVSGNSVTRHTIGKLPAWIEYMTAVDEAHGDLADPNGENSFMILNRSYEFDEVNRCIKDATTYVEPSKYNYAFAYTYRDSQNFWVQIVHKNIARRKMSAKQIPNI